MKTNHNRLSAGLAVAALTVSGVCLGTSLWQSKMFIQVAMGTGAQSAVMVAGLFGVLLGSQCIARMTAQCIKAGTNVAFILLGIIAILCIEGMSIGISTVSFDGNLLASSRSTNLSSPEYLAIQDSIALYKEQIRSLQTQAKELPANWITRRNEINEQIMSLQANINAQQRAASGINVSISDQAFGRMEATVGIGQDKIALIMGLLLSLVPLVVNLLAGSLNWVEPAKSGKGSPQAKKPRAKLRAVTA